MTDEIRKLVIARDACAAACKLALADLEASARPKLPNGRARKQWDKQFVIDTLRDAIAIAEAP